MRLALNLLPHCLQVPTFEPKQLCKGPSALLELGYILIDGEKALNQVLWGCLYSTKPFVKDFIWDSAFDAIADGKVLPSLHCVYVHSATFGKEMTKSPTQWRK